MKKKDLKQVLYLIDCQFADVRTYVDFALTDEIESKDPKIETIKDLSRAKKALDELEELVSMLHLN
jgi:hypothetical protein